MIKFVFVVSVAFVCFDSGAGQGYRSAAAYQGRGGYEDANYGPPMPYNFQYDTVDEYGTQLVRNEQKDAAGTVTGSYSYRDADGLYRIVDYVADKNGFRANVRTNEPGTAKDHSGDPADTQWEIEPPPANVVQKWGGQGGYKPGVRPTGRRPQLLRAPAPSIEDEEYNRYLKYPRY